MLERSLSDSFCISHPGSGPGIVGSPSKVPLSECVYSRVFIYFSGQVGEGAGGISELTLLIIGPAAFAGGGSGEGNTRMGNTSVNNSPSLRSSPRGEMTHEQKASWALLLPVVGEGVRVVEMEAAQLTFTFHDLGKQENQTDTFS